MDFLGGNFSSASVYNEIRAIYIRDIKGKLLNVIRGEYESVESALATIFRNHPLLFGISTSKIPVQFPNYSYEFPNGCQWVKDCVEQLCRSMGETRTDASNLTLGLQEVQKPADNVIIGILYLYPQISNIHSQFRQWFIALILSNSRIPTPWSSGGTDQNSEHLCRKISELFDLTLRNVARDDQWELGGRSLFEDQAYRFISQGARIEFCLPAFPCKSSNDDKVVGFLPDKGEEIALRNLISFLHNIGKMYKPGAKLWIISDGHVFSDCIGVDDVVVDSYNATLKAACNDLLREEDASLRDSIGFCSLWDLLLGSAALNHQLDQSTISEMNVPHFLDTRLSPVSELCRKVLLAGCQVDSLQLRAAIEDQDPAKLALYRGFSKFMLEDLSLHPASQKLSKSQRKKMSSNIAFEMIKRNHAYSNLVELLFPQHIRLSIHAHNNRGPKFGISLLGNNTAKLGTFDGIHFSSSSDDLLHIPTPWHNCVFRIDGNPTYYVAKSRVIREILKTGKYNGHWAEGKKGLGYFLLRSC